MRPVGTAGGPEAAPVDRPPRRRLRVLLACVAAVGVVALGFWWLVPAGPPPLTPGDVDRAVARGIERSDQEKRNTPPDATRAYLAITPSLVTVTTQRPGSGPATGTVETGLGSGVVINASGAVLTALHVVEGAERIQVAFADGTLAAARVAASQPGNDVAVLATDRLPEIVVPAVMAGTPPVGDTVFAVGNPLGLQRSLTAGVVSATDRRIGTPRGALDGLIQFDAAVNPGNSGGPLLNRAGQVVGIVTGLANPTEQDYFVGVGFAVPIATAGGAAGGPQQ